MDKNVASSVTEKTKTIDSVASATRVFLGTAIGLGFVVSAAAFVMMPKTVLKSPPKVSNTALTASDVTGARSTMDHGEFLPLRYKVNTSTVFTQTNQEGNADTNPGVKTGNVSIELASMGSASRPQWMVWLGVNEVSAQATTFSIETIPSLPAQIIQLSYRRLGDSADRQLTVCLGTNSVSKVYVGSDGSTYTDSGLTRRTTVQPCATIVQRALRFSQLTSGHVTSEPSSDWRTYFGTWSFLMGPDLIGDANVDGNLTISDPATQTYPPLLVRGIAGGSFPSVTVPRSIINLNGQSSTGTALTATLCYPETLIGSEHQDGYRGYYYDTAGNPYNDIFLGQSVSCTAGGGGIEPIETQ